MLQRLVSIFDRKAAPEGAPVIPSHQPELSALRRPAGPQQTFSKVFRWRAPDGRPERPASVEVVGSFTQWQKVPLTREHNLDGWQVTVHQIPGHRTHHYMILVDGQPVFDSACDGLAVPAGPHEAQYQVMTDKGPRVMMLFAQTK